MLIAAFNRHFRKTNIMSLQQRAPSELAKALACHAADLEGEGPARVKLWRLSQET
jgi:hypothetical protein